MQKAVNFPTGRPVLCRSVFYITCTRVANQPGIFLFSQVLWMRRLRVLRRLLVKYRTAGKIDKHLYHELYQLSKGNTFKHKRALVEHVSRSPMNSFCQWHFSVLPSTKNHQKNMI